MNDQQNQESTNFEFQNFEENRPTDKESSIENFDAWLDTELAKLVDQNKNFVTKNSNRGYFSR